MEFTVPQFTEYEAKVIGPLSFKQFIVVGAAGIACFAIWIKFPLIIAIPLMIIIGGGSLALIFLRIEGRSLMVVLKNFFFFSISPQVYIWKRKIIPPRILKREPVVMEPEEEPTLQIIKKGKLQDLSIKLETRKRK